MSEETTYRIFDDYQKAYDEIVKALEEENFEYVLKETLLEYKEWFEVVGLMLYSPIPRNLLPSWEGYR